MTTLNLPDYNIANIVSLWDIGPLINAEVIRKPEGVVFVFASGKVATTGFKNVSVAGVRLQEIYSEKNYPISQGGKYYCSQLRSLYF